MEKPLILVQAEMKKELIALVNKYAIQIPAITIVDSLQLATEEARRLAEVQYQKAQADYEEAQKKEAEEEQSDEQ